MLLEQASDWLGWPHPARILDPSGEGAAACASLAKSKIGEPLKRGFPGLELQTGILTPDPGSATTASPLAIVCELPRGAQPEILREAHRLAWNFSRSALLITLEPHRLVAWSCYQDPSQEEELRQVCHLSTEPTSRGSSDQRQIRLLLHWVSLITGDVLRRRSEHFPADGRADQLLLKNLKEVRSRLVEDGLERNVCHDLLARVIFTQFLFHRKDSSGNPFFNKNLLDRRCNGALRDVHSELASILTDKEDTYSLFQWLDERFNGDLFPGEGASTGEERLAAWNAERSAVKPSHLQLLADFVAGDVDTTDRQMLLWPQYSFDTIPLEFISSAYEEFLTGDREKSKAYYTPSHLVDYVLDAVLPWEGRRWDLRILDPACGSGIFLVKAFQRIIHRWRRAHDREPLVRDLKPLLANNFYGVDRDPDAVRVACFSLYLAMADAIEPKHYLTRERVFPRLRGSRLVAKDFFDESTEGFRTEGDQASFDLVIGNAPWGENSSKVASDDVVAGKGRTRQQKMTKAQSWAKRFGWPITNHDIGPLFVAKGLPLINDAGRLAMLQPASSWLYNRAKPAEALRAKLFGDYTVDEVTNLSALRHELFSGAIGPACVIVAGRGKPAPSHAFPYFTPKPIGGPMAANTIDSQRFGHVTQREAAKNPWVWSILALGRNRDLQLIYRFRDHDNLAKLKKKGVVLTRQGVIPGKAMQKRLDEHQGRRMFEAPNFPGGTFLDLDASAAGIWHDPLVTERDSTNFEAFKNPQLLIKQGFVKHRSRFRAVRVRPDDPEWGVICKSTYMTVRDLSNDGRYLDAAALVYNSLFGAYFIALTSSRMGHYRTEAKTNEVLAVPLPEGCPDLSEVTRIDDIDRLTRKAFSLTEADWLLVEDLLNVSLADASRASGPGLRPTNRGADADDNDPDLAAYGKTFVRVLRSTFGPEHAVATTIFKEPDDVLLPVRMITLHLNDPDKHEQTFDVIDDSLLLDQLASFNRDSPTQSARAGDAPVFGRIAFLFHPSQQGHVTSLTIVKPDEYRYWTRSQAMSDADELASAILQAAGRETRRT